MIKELWIRGWKEWKPITLAGVAVFLLWAILDFIIHVVILRNEYEATKSLWRPEGEMKMALMYVVLFLVAFSFVKVYVLFFRNRCLATGTMWGLIFGFMTGLSMGYGSYSVMPLTYTIALVWFLGSLVEGSLAGVLVGLIAKERI